MSRDFKDLLRLFAEQRVEYLIVGGYAVICYTQPRYTKDIDLWVRPTKDNAARVAKVFGIFGISLIEVTQEDFGDEGLQFLIGLPPNAIDFLTTIKGLNFENSWSRKRVFDTPECPLNYISPSDLIISKKAAGRLQDLADIEEILRILPEAANPE